jgi:hypothetical protein
MARMILEVQIWCNTPESTKHPRDVTGHHYQQPKTKKYKIC